MRLSNIILRVADMERSLRFYRDAVGLTVLSESPAFSFLALGDVRVALNQMPRDAVPTDTELVIEVDDIAATHDAMRRRGVDFRVEPRLVMEQGGRGLHAADFRDPDGHLWSITGWV